MLPDAPVLITGIAHCLWMSSDGELEELSLEDAKGRAEAEPPILCHSVLAARRLGISGLASYDLLELFAFVRPAQFLVPTPGGIADALSLARPSEREDEAATLLTATQRLLAELAARTLDKNLIGIAWTMANAGWSWGPFVLSSLGFSKEQPRTPRAGDGYDIWKRLPQWEEEAPPAPPGGAAISETESRSRLAELLGEDAESRPQQSDYAAGVAAAFAPRLDPDQPNLVLAEAGTGVGKTLGYIAPASLWSEKNEAPVWISTYTRNLQNQVDRELDRLYPQHAEKRKRVVVRKGRENYLCLLNLEEAVRAMPAAQNLTIALGLMVRWAGATRDGDMVGGDFPGWLVGLLGSMATLGLTDRRGECIYSACPHYARCFIEHSQRRAKTANIVVANHALVLIRAALDGGEEGQLPGHIIFDEGHHLFEAADSAFAAHLSGQEGQELRRWLLGGEGRRRAALRSKGLAKRVEDLIPLEGSAHEELELALRAAHILPGDGWRQRLAEDNPLGPAEAFLGAVRHQTLARNDGGATSYGLEAATRPCDERLLEKAVSLSEALGALEKPLDKVRRFLLKRLEEEAEELDGDMRARIEALARGIERRALATLAAWRDMLDNLSEEETPQEFCDWLAIERNDGREMDVGYYRHWVDPSLPLARTLLTRLQGGVITSATLTDEALINGSVDEEGPKREIDWSAADARSGAVHLEGAAKHLSVSSPFDYGTQTRVLIVNDVRRDSLDQVASAYRTLFLAAGGGALGLFTAIQRLRAVHQKVARVLEEEGLSLLAQHVDAMDTGTLVDIFRAEEQSCLLGTDAVRDGVDVPGDSLRLIVFDRVPWTRPDLVHKARRGAFGGRDYDDRLARLKLRQAFGRLVRRADDRGVFVILDSRLPSRLLSAFPSGVEIKRCGLAEAIHDVKEFLRRPPEGKTSAIE